MEYHLGLKTKKACAEKESAGHNDQKIGATEMKSDTSKVISHMNNRIIPKEKKMNKNGRSRLDFG